MGHGEIDDFVASSPRLLEELLARAVALKGEDEKQKKRECGQHGQCPQD